MQISVRGYETQVKVFLLLVVLFLVTANLVAINFLTRTESLLEQEAGARALRATGLIVREVERQGFLARISERLPGAAEQASRFLTEMAGTHGATVAEIVDGRGRVIASSQSWRHGVVEPLEGFLEAADLVALRTRRPIVASRGGGEPVVLSLVSLDPKEGDKGLYLKAGYYSQAMETIASRIQLLTWSQGIGGSLVLIMVLLFTRYVLRPYRELRAAAANLEEPGRPPEEADDPAFLVASFRGVVEKMRSVEAELERMRRGPSSTGSQESLLAGLSSGVLILSPSGIVEALNPAGEKILGTSAGSVAGRPASEVFRRAPELLALLEDAVRLGRGRTREMVPYKGDGGKTVHLGVTVSSPPGGAGGALCLFSDLTEIRSLQARVLLKENLARVGELSAGIAHEFRNSLATILGYARLTSKDASQAEESSQAIIREVSTMERVVSEFLRYAGPARLSKSECDLRALLEETAREVTRDGASPVKVVLEGEWPAAMNGDEELLRQAFHNLIRNAVEAAREGEGPGLVTVTGALGNGAVTVEVADSGPGFSDEVLEKLFTPFVTTKERGTGLGMAMAQKVIVSHDGSLEAANRAEGGGSVRATLPLA